MKVLIVSQEYPPESHWGGIATYMGLLAPALARSGAEVQVLSVAPGVATSTTERGGVLVHRRALFRPKGSGLLGLRETWRRLTQAASVAYHVRRLAFSPDIVVCTSWQAEGLFLSRRAPVAVHVFSSAPEVLQPHALNEVDRRLAIALEDRLVRRASVVLSPPAQLERVVSRLSLAGPAIPVDCPVAADDAAPVPPSPPTIAFFGRLEPRKAPELLVRALPAVRAAIPHVRLVLAGRDSSTPEHASYGAWLRRLAAELGVGDAVEILDQWSGHDRVKALTARAAVVAVPSTWESFGYVAAEASAAGRPVVVSNIPSFADIVEDGVTGLVVPADPGAWSDALIRVLTDGALARRLGAAGAARMRQRFGPDRVARATLDIYERVVAGHRPHRRSVPA